MVWRVLVLAGGASAERDVSLESGRNVAAALREGGHQVDLLDSIELTEGRLDPERWDVVFPVVHGTGGEDGELQRTLAASGMLYIGSSAEASELTFDKCRTNRFLADHGIVVPPGCVLSVEDSTEVHLEMIHRILRTCPRISERPQWVVKPARQGSSIGVSMIADERRLPEAIELAFQYDRNCLVEEYIGGREVTVPVIDGQTYPAIEIQPATEWYDYTAKYSDDRTQYRILPEEDCRPLHEIARRACEVCGVTGMARVDFRVAEDGRRFVLEINTVPGMTTHSLVPMSARAAGMSLCELCERLILHRLCGPNATGEGSTSSGE
ncbi:MAG: D-alanine--D-alanine ligase [Planctomycetaceae bacterium]